MNIPEKVKIGGLIYDVSEEKNAMRDKSEAGSSCGNLQEIRIEESVSKQLKESTFIHEVIHQIDFVYNIGLDHQQVYQLEAGIYAFIKDNPLIFNNGFDANYILAGNIDKEFLKVGKIQGPEEDEIDKFNEFHDALRKIDEATLKDINNGNLLRLLKVINDVKEK